MENHHFSWENPLLMTIFNSYVKLPEGRCLDGWFRIIFIVGIPCSGSNHFLVSRLEVS
jgi:hypothetical protein